MGADAHLDALAEGLKEAFSASPDPAVRRAHLAAMAQVEIDQVAVPRRKRRVAVRGAVAAAGLVLVGGSALAATGNMPDPVQNAIADAVDAVVDIPGGQKSADGGDPANPIAAANKAEAEAFTDAKKAYNACLKAEREAASPDPSASPVASECGEKPERKDFEVTKTPKPDKTAKPERTVKPERSPGGASASHVPDRTPRPVRTEKPERTNGSERPAPPVDLG